MTDSGLPLVIDLFAGTGSATEPFVRCGRHRVVHVDIAPPSEIRADVRRLPAFLTRERPEFVWASPPCDDFVDVPWHADLRIPGRGLALWEAAFKWAEPFPHVFENVRGAQRYLGSATTHAGSRYLWTNVALGLLPKVYGKWRLPPSEDRKRLRSMIPRPLAEAVHAAVCDDTPANPPRTRTEDVT